MVVEAAVVEAEELAIVRELEVLVAAEEEAGNRALFLGFFNGNLAIFLCSFLADKVIRFVITYRFMAKVHFCLSLNY
jgi:hypothetical protein